jgi:EAL domain-containing protein (putative c-di-GMP-specific phosphodiesterase class I)
MHFQPIVDLRSQGVVGYEALARGPVDSPWERPEALFAQAKREGRLREMDWACRVAAVRDVRACSVRLPAWRLFLNTEPEVLGTICPEELLADWVGGTDDLQIVVEVTERALVHGPRRLIAAVAELRELGCEIALDDVGANEPSVALLPLIEPDVVKMDARLLGSAQDEVGLASLRAVAGYVERSGAVLVAEGIETEHERARAVALGAHWGQGYLFARPRPLDVRDTADRHAVAARGPARQPRPVDDLTVDRSAAPRLVADEAWLGEHLEDVLRAAVEGASMNVLLLRLPDPAVAPAGFFEQLSVLQEECALTAVVLGEAGRAVLGGPGRAPLDGPMVADQVLALLLGPSVCRATVATSTGAGRYDVLLEERAEHVAALARRFLGRA